MTIAIFTTGGTIDKVYFDAKGSYHVYSSVGTDEDKGMSATLIVK